MTAQQNSLSALRMCIGLLAMLVVTSCHGGNRLDSVCSDGVVAAHRHNYERAMNIWAEASMDASARMKLRAVIDCMIASDIAEDNEAVAAWLLKRAYEGNVQAQLYIGMLYAIGVGVGTDKDVAARWLNEAAGHGSEAAAFLGEKLREGME